MPLERSEITQEIAKCFL